MEQQAEGERGDQQGHAAPGHTRMAMGGALIGIMDLRRKTDIATTTTTGNSAGATTVTASLVQPGVLNCSHHHSINLIMGWMRDDPALCYDREPNSRKIADGDDDIRTMEERQRCVR